ncbi:MAG: sugar phosphate nucleotidyltransferase [Candidatus Micrarchaeia archaeon]|jgi:NDP-sugar pyrophosphorylase family protein
MSKERLTITLDRRILDEVDATIDGINVRNRSHAIEKLIEVALSQNVPQKAVILAGGNTIRQNGKTIPKAMANVAGKPIIEYTIQMLVRNGVNDFIILAGEKSEEITSYLGDGSRFGAKITYLIEEKRKGTEGALLLAKGLVGNWPFFVVNGDNFYDFRISEMYKQHIATKALVTIALTTAESTKGFGATKLEGSKILDFVEKPYYYQSKLVSTGFYLFSKEALDLISPNSSEPVMLEKSLFPRLASLGRLYGFVISGKWAPLASSEIESSIKEIERLAKAK